jgi:hypothetical protein
VAMVVQPGAALTCCCWRIDALRQACGVLVALKQTLRTVLKQHQAAIHVRLGGLLGNRSNPIRPPAPASRPALILSLQRPDRRTRRARVP